MSTELTTTGTSNEIEGMEGLSAQDVILPRLSIVQPTSQGKGDKPGVFHNNLTQETTPSVKAVILKINKTRTLWSGNMADKAPECSSDNGVTSRDGTKHCEGCEFNRWDPDLKTCRQGYTLLCFNPEDETMFLLTAMGASVKPVKVLNSLFVNKHRSPFSAITELCVKKIEDPSKGKYWILDPKVSEWLEPEQAARYRDAYVSMRSVVVRDADEVVTSEADDDLPF